MNRNFGATALCSAALLLTACGGGGNGTAVLPVTPPAAIKPTVAVDDLATGSYVVSTGDANAPTVGKYYAAADGSRLLVIADSDDHAKQTYRRDAGGAWVGVPAADKDVRVTLIQSSTQPDTGASIAKAAGHYRVQAAAGVTADFSVAADGTIVPGSSACKLSGKVSPGTLPNTLRLSLATSACGTLPASSSGVIALDSDYAPASFRMVTDDGAQLVDLWAYVE
ncbi:hypothetical protein [Variovorax sp. GT1P44]|uniref:hypothetical protein n=1 Tax=Variovorax sp. GT1P44 TaxID=3443742 RepID=UPI003F44F6ED